MVSQLQRALITLFALLTPASLTLANDFLDGEVYVLRGSPTVVTVGTVDPVAGTLTDLTAILPVASTAELSYDPFRDRLILCGNQIDELQLVDSTGQLTTISYSWAGNATTMAPTGDGRIYLGEVGGRIGYLDECDQFHELLHPHCAVPFLTDSGLQRLVYDPALNALFAADGVGNIANIRRIELTADGTRVTGVVDESSFFVSSSGHSITDLGAGPSGSWLMSVDTNDNNVNPRLLTIDAATLQFSIFAQTQTPAQFGAAFHPALDVAFFSIGSSSINAVTSGAVGNGTVVVGGTGAVKSLCVIGQTVGPNPIVLGSPDCNTNGVPDGCDLADGTSVDCNGNGVPDECDIASGTSGDSDGDGIPDACDAPDPTSYTEGDIFVRRLTGFPDDEILRVDPVTGCITVHATVPLLSDFGPIYDPYRDAIVFALVGANELVLVSHTGEVTTESYDWGGAETGMTAAGDGRIFFGNNDGRLALLDTCGEMTEVVDAAGDPFVLSGAFYERMLFDYDSDMLYVADGLGNMTNVHRIPLSADGTEVIGPVLSSSYFVSPSGHAITGLSAGPAGFLLVSVDTNDNDPHPRLLLVDLLGLIIQPYAETATAAQYGGSYHSSRDEAVILSGSQSASLLVYGQGDTAAEGEILTPGTIGNPRGLVVIGESVIGNPPVVGTIDCNENGLPDLCDLDLGTSLDCNGNGLPDECDIESGISVDTNANGIPDECETPFIRGDVDGSGAPLINDAILVLEYLFLGGTVPCLDAVDVSDDGAVLLNDAIWLLSYLFQSGAPPAAPFPVCGLDPTLDGGGDLGCEGPLSGCP